LRRHGFNCRERVVDPQAGPRLPAANPDLTVRFTSRYASRAEWAYAARNQHLVRSFDSSA